MWVSLDEKLHISVVRLGYNYSAETRGRGSSHCAYQRVWLVPLSDKDMSHTSLPAVLQKPFLLENTLTHTHTHTHTRSTRCTSERTPVLQSLTRSSLVSRTNSQGAMHQIAHNSLPTKTQKHLNSVPNPSELPCWILSKAASQMKWDLRSDQEMFKQISN